LPRNAKKEVEMENKGEIVIYEVKDGNIRLDINFKRETIWLNLNQMALLFDRDKSAISRHLHNIFKTKELDRNSVVANFATTAIDGKVYSVDFYNLDAIISVGYRVNSKVGTRFRIWATNILRKHLIDGYTFPYFSHPRHYGVASREAEEEDRVSGEIGGISS
jgi:hypothetical protein